VDLTHFQNLIGEKNHIVWWQMSVRAVIIFIYGVTMMRVAGRRAFGRAAPLDIIVSVLIGSNLSRALTGNAPLLPTLAATTALVFVYWLVLYTAYLSRFASWLVKGRSTLLIGGGRIDWKSMKQEGLTEGDLAEAMRASGVKHVEDVEAAYRERNGSISIIRK